MLDKSRIGKIVINRDAIEDGDVPDLFYALRITVLRSEFMYSRNCIEYECQSPLFENLPDGVEAPLYDVIVNVADDGARTYSVKRYAPKVAEAIA